MFITCKHNSEKEQFSKVNTKNVYNKYETLME